MANEREKIFGSAKVHTFEGKSQVYNAGLLKSAISNLTPREIGSQSFYDLAIVEDKEASKMQIVENKFRGEQSTPLKNAVLFFSVNVNDLTRLISNDDFINFNIARKDSVAENKSSFANNEYVCYQSQQNDKPIYFGSGFTFKSKDGNLGVAFIDNNNTSQKEFINLMLNKNDLLSAPKSQTGKVYINLFSIEGHSNMLSARVSNNVDLSKDAAYTISLDPGKINLLSVDIKGNCKITFAKRNPTNILSDHANFNAYDPLTSGADTFYVGKGWDQEAMLKLNAEKKNSNDFKIGDPVEFKVPDNFYLNKYFGNIEHSAYGVITQLLAASAMIDSATGTVAVEFPSLKKSSIAQVDSFNKTLDSLKARYTEEHKNKTVHKPKAATNLKETISIKGANKPSKDKKNGMSL